MRGEDMGYWEYSTIRSAQVLHLAQKERSSSLDAVIFSQEETVLFQEKTFERLLALSLCQKKGFSPGINVTPVHSLSKLYRFKSSFLHSY